jgi:hypothetical protein
VENALWDLSLGFIIKLLLLCFTIKAVTIVFPGDYSEGETPDPIPNSAVKPFSVDDTTIGGKVEHRQGFFLFSARAENKNPE